MSYEIWWRLIVQPPWPPDGEIIEAVFETQRDAESAAELMRKAYRGQRLKTKIEQVEPCDCGTLIND